MIERAAVAGAIASVANTRRTSTVARAGRAEEQSYRAQDSEGHGAVQVVQA
jgi:hypothetical protein